MKATHVRVRYRQSGSHIDVTFWAGIPAYTFANVGTLTMDRDDALLFREILGRDERVEQTIERGERWPAK